MIRDVERYIARRLSRSRSLCLHMYSSSDYRSRSFLWSRRYTVIISERGGRVEVRIDYPEGYGGKSIAKSFSSVERAARFVAKFSEENDLAVVKPSSCKKSFVSLRSALSLTLDESEALRTLLARAMGFFSGSQLIGFTFINPSGTKHRCIERGCRSKAEVSVVIRRKGIHWTIYYCKRCLARALEKAIVGYFVYLCDKVYDFLGVPPEYAEFI